LIAVGQNVGKNDRQPAAASPLGGWLSALQWRDVGLDVNTAPVVAAFAAVVAAPEPWEVLPPVSGGVIGISLGPDIRRGLWLDVVACCHNERRKLSPDEADWWPIQRWWPKRGLRAVGSDLLDMLGEQHSVLLAARPDTRPGMFKERPNYAGGYAFVAPDLVDGTLRRGFAALDPLTDPFPACGRADVSS
jgi:hypothetical protein